MLAKGPTKGPLHACWCPTAFITRAEQRSAGPNAEHSSAAGVHMHGWVQSACTEDHTEHPLEQPSKTRHRAEDLLAIAYLIGAPGPYCQATHVPCWPCGPPGGRCSGSRGPGGRPAAPGAMALSPRPAGCSDQTSPRRRAHKPKAAAYCPSCLWGLQHI